MLTQYYDFLMKMVTFFTVTPEDLQSNPFLWDHEWALTQTRNSSIFQELQYRAMLTAPYSANESHTHKSRPYFQEILGCCMALADDFIILQIMKNELESNVEKPLRELTHNLDEVTSRIDALQSETGDAFDSNHVKNLISRHRKTIAPGLQRVQLYTERINPLIDDLWKYASPKGSNWPDAKEHIFIQCQTRDEDIEQFYKDIYELRINLAANRTLSTRYNDENFSSTVRNCDPKEKLWYEIFELVNDFKKSRKALQDTILGEYQELGVLIPAITSFIEYIKNKA